MPEPSRFRRRAVGWLLMTALLLLGAGGAAVLAATMGPTVVPGLPPAESVAGPVRLHIPAIGVSSQLERLDLADDGSLRTPRDPARAGWFSGGPRPGEVGPAVVVGHVDSGSGPAVFSQLDRLRRGDLVTMQVGDGTSRDFRVRRVRLVPVDRFPSDAVYAPTPARALRLITCGGNYDYWRGRYRSNVVVFAERV